MILRRFANSIQEQNWFTVVLEITIVVVVIFVGLQVDSLNEERKDRTLEQRYLERLHADAIAAVERQTHARVSFQLFSKLPGFADNPNLRLIRVIAT